MKENIVYYQKETEHVIIDSVPFKFEFASSLLDFLYLDLSGVDCLQRLIDAHIYFRMLDLRNSDIRETLSCAKKLQKFLETLFSDVFDILPENEPIQERMTKYLSAHKKNARFAFGQLTTGFAQVDDNVFAETLSPTNFEEIVEFFVREFIRRDLHFRRCKCCGKYFAMTVHANTEYCDRPFGNSGKTCRESGAIRIYRTKILADAIVIAFNRAYKKHFAWIRYKKITKEEFYEWSERARAARDKYTAIRDASDDDNVRIGALEDFEQWLRDN